MSSSFLLGFGVVASASKTRENLVWSVIFATMATIFYSMAGEGRGHATRVKAIVDDLRTRHRVVLFAPGQAAALLGPIYRGSDVDVRAIEGLCFHYKSDGSVDYLRTAFESAKGLGGFSKRIEKLERLMDVDRPDLIITDFEPLLPRAGGRAGIPYVSLDHQHFLTTYSLDDLPRHQRLHAFLLGIAVRLFHRRPNLTIVSAFFRPPLRAAWRSKVRQVGVLLGRDILEKTPTDGGFLLVYLRRGTPSKVFLALAECGIPAKIYGTGKTGVEGNLSFCTVDRGAFVEDLARCRALVTTAGNQVVGEALHLGKPILALPEPGNWEQGLNGFFVEQMGVGKCVSLHALQPETIREFLGGLQAYRAGMPEANIDGNAEVARILEGFIDSLPVRRSGAMAWMRLDAAFRKAVA